MTWYALCIGGGYDEDEGEDEGSKVATLDHGPGPAWAPEKQDNLNSAESGHWQNKA